MCGDGIQQKINNKSDSRMAKKAELHTLRYGYI
jgi:hypothetical protein